MDKLVDFSQPIEAVYRDDRVRKANVIGVGQAGDSISALVEIEGGQTYAVSADGTAGADFRVQNTAKPSTPSNEELTQRMEKVPELHDRLVQLARAIAEVPTDSVLGQSCYASEARSIVSDLPKPVDPIDPDLREARECVALVYEGAARPDLAESTRAGKQDNRLRVQSARLAIARGRTLAAGGTAHDA